jgi:hypothetical protein
MIALLKFLFAFIISSGMAFMVVSFIKGNTKVSEWAEDYKIGVAVVAFILTIIISVILWVAG